MPTSRWLRGLRGTSGCSLQHLACSGASEVAAEKHWQSLNKDSGLRRTELCHGHFEFDTLLGHQGRWPPAGGWNVFVPLHWVPSP